MDKRNHNLLVRHALSAGILFLLLVSVSVTLVAGAEPEYLPATYGLLVLIAYYGSMPYLRKMEAL